MNAEHAELETQFAAPVERDLPPGRLDLHREILMNHMLTATRHAEPAQARRGRRPRRRILAVGGTAAAVIGAAAVAVTVIGPPTAPSRPPARGHVTSSAPTSPLIRLASYVTASAHTQPGDATLVIRNTTGQSSGSFADLYTDSGAYYGAHTKSGLSEQVAAHHELGRGMFAREIAAAIFAAKNGDLAIARKRMADDPAADSRSAGSGPAAGSAAAIAIKAKLIGVKPAPGQSLVAAVNAALFNNLVWVNSVDALVAGSGTPEVRAGVLRLLSTVPGITVTHAYSDGQPTLVVADTMPAASPYESVLTLNSRTGIPIEFASGPVGKTPDVTVTYQVSRVTVAAIAAGKF